jgi:hypothetical protein
MKGLLLLGTIIENLLSRDSTIHSAAHAGTDRLPPVLGPSDWSDGLMASMADRSTAWYFDRR